MSSADLPLIETTVPHDERVERVIAAFEREFGRQPKGIAEAPGRVNLIGEHVDYNDGLVLPFAIDRSVLCAWGDIPAEWLPPPEVIEKERQILASTFPTFAPTPGISMNLYSVDLECAVELLEIDELTPLYTGANLGGEAFRWGSYIAGVAIHLRQGPGELESTDAVMQGDVPIGAGLSSSAAVEVALAGALREDSSLPIDNVELARVCQRAENEYVGVQSGIMDQFASALSKREHALLIDCRSLGYEHIPLRLDAAGYTVVIANSAVQRELVSSAFNERRRECEQAVAILRERLGRPELASLRDVRVKEIESLEIGQTDPVFRRARHVVHEIARVASAVEALRQDDFLAFGELMAESHLSLRRDYEVTSPELDLLVALADAQDYVAGARMTGAGFGGCTVNIVETGAVERFARDVVAPYRQRTGLPAVMYVTSPQDGLRTWRL